ncbi:MAG: hypothetical protein LBK71_10020, partial [Verrucomicrobiales bacterium]|nr:hypothetical protein [Verrucomicrobiales bacterium]
MINLPQLLHHPALTALLQDEANLSLGGLPVSAQAWLLAAWRLRRAGEPLVALTPDARTREAVANDLAAWRCDALTLPEPDDAAGAGTGADPETQAEMLDTLGTLLVNANQLLLVTQAGWERRWPAPAALRQQGYEIRRGQPLPRAEFLARLVSAGYQREGLVSQRGQYAVRGGIVDVFSWSGMAPLRMEWSGDAVDSIREFALAEQRSVARLEAAHLALGARPWPEEETAPLAAYFATPPLTVSLAATAAAGQSLPVAEFFEHDFLHQPTTDPVLLETRNQLLAQQLRDWFDHGWQVWISSNNAGEEQRLKEWCRERRLALAAADGAPPVKFCQSPLLRGFGWTAQRLAVLTDAE